MTFQQELILSIVNSIGIGAIVGLCGFILNLLLEKYKTTQALREEAAKLRIVKISEVWDGLEKIHIKLIQIGLEIIEIKYKDKSANNEIDTISENAVENLEKKVAPKISNIAHEQIPSMRYKIQSYRFWLGKKLVEEHIKQLNALSQLSRTIENDLVKGELDFKQKDLTDAVSLVESTKKDIVEIMRYI